MPDKAAVLDAGAGFNTFLPHVAKAVNRSDIGYYATDAFVQGQGTNKVRFIAQPGEYELPNNPQSADGKYDVIIFRAVLHHVKDLDRMIAEVKKKLKPNGKLILIEDSFDDQISSIYEGAQSMTDDILNDEFSKLATMQKILFEKFNDWYANHMYHDWTEMAIPFNHRALSGWRNKLMESGMSIEKSLNMGFPNNSYAVHQPFTLIMVCSNAISQDVTAAEQMPSPDEARVTGQAL